LLLWLLLLLRLLLPLLLRLPKRIASDGFGADPTSHAHIGSERAIELASIPRLAGDDDGRCR
jgi:hypothetical protein